MNAEQWSDHLRALARQALAGTPLDGASRSVDTDVGDFVDTFRDEHGHRRAVDRPLLCRLLGRDPGPAPDGASIDVRIWHALAHPDQASVDHDPGPGPLIGTAAFQTGAIETTTETELAALHGLWHLGETRPALRARCLDAARWHVETLQPDNGTNHPWAVHVFVALADAEGDSARAHEAMLHAETLVHNAVVNLGRPDRFSACVLLDSANALAGDAD
jgi:hypothetical protein